MIDPATLAATAVTCLVPFLTEAGKAVAKRVGDAATDKTVQLYTFLKSKLTSPGASEALAKLEKTPDEADRQTLFRLTLKDVLVDDPQFREELAVLLKALAPATSGVTQSAHVVGNENEVVQVSGAGNTVTMGRK
ncbi:MAG: hypothetical protein HYZ50_09990 [Deltaproteobacteria bacterium]|nr:hypothetical protein [Deltaproteobacteria bacterium]